MASKKLFTVNSILSDTSCEALLRDLQVIWDEIGEDGSERDKVLLQIEEEFIDVYRRKVDQAKLSRTRMHQLLADSEAELAHLVSALGETFSISSLQKHTGSLREQLAAIEPTLTNLREKKEERIKQFREMQEQIARISAEIARNSCESYERPCVAQNDLSMKKLNEYRVQLQQLQKEKNERIQKITRYVDSVHVLSVVMGLEFSKILTDVHPSLDNPSQRHSSKSITDSTLAKLALQVEELKAEKQARLQKIQKLSTMLIELWNLMDTSLEERRTFNHITSYISASVDDIVEPGALSLDIIEQAEIEVKRLDQLKVSKLKELLLRKQSELEEICRNAHMGTNIYSTQERLMAMIDCGTIDHSQLLTSMDNQIAKAKEEALSRKEIMEKVEKWMTACEEENWLEEYNMDENRYSVSRGAHINLKRAERARVIVNRIPALVESLMAKTRAWEEERGAVFFYDDVPLFAMLEEYNMLRQEREEQRRRLRDKKRLQGQLLQERESYFGSKPGSLPLNKFQAKGPSRVDGISVNSVNMNRHSSLTTNATPNQRAALNGSQSSRYNFSASKDGKRGAQSRLITNLHYSSIQARDSSQFSVGSVSSSP